MEDFKYFVLVETETLRECPYFDTLDEALAKYNSVEKKNLSTSVCLGIESKERSFSNDFVCFDVLHKFIDGNILINDYISKDRADVREAVFEIINKVSIKYQFTSQILGGVLIPFGGNWACTSDEETMSDKWNEIYLSTYKDGEMAVVGWQPNERKTYDDYGWAYRETASYAEQVNVRFTDKKGGIHDKDIDVREYMHRKGMKFTGE